LNEQPREWDQPKTPQEDPRARICEASKWDVQQVSENEEIDVKGSAPSEVEKEAAYGVMAGYGGVLATPRVMALFGGGREKFE
jgi:hypothetical protein